MGVSPTSAIYGDYNARSTPPARVAEKFVAPPQFWDIAAPGNTIIRGPRGSGKTTILKMLEGEALESWPDSQASRARELVTYSGIFVPADRSWSGQMAKIEERLDDEQLSDRLGEACFVLHSLRALARCAAVRVSLPAGKQGHNRVPMERAQQEKIATGVWRSWALPEPVGSFEGLRFALSDEISSIGRLVRSAERNVEAIEELRRHPALTLDVIEAAIPLIERFNFAAGQEDHVWSFLIDEIEFLPPGIHDVILGAMRGRDPRIVQKVSLAPYTRLSEELSKPLGGWEGHDLRSVDLVFKEKKAGYEFSRKLVMRELADVQNAPGFPQLFGGPGFFERPSGEDGYGEGSENLQAIKDLVAKDSSFAEWLRNHDIDVTALSEASELERASTVRKAIPIILLRDAYLREGDDAHLRGRSRKSPPTYVGEHSSYAICENNPRLLKALLWKLIRRDDEDRLTDGRRGDAIKEAAEEYRLHMRAIEVPGSVSETLLPRQFVDAVGSHFAAGIYGEDFDPEPPLSFTVSAADLRRGDNLEQVLTQLTFYGALVQIGERDERRFRLGYMLAPVYRLALRRGRSHALRSILPLGNSSDVVGQLPIDEGDD
jgi:hypothetical protein